ncbi:MAG: hypothetical protein JSS75_07125 [Bacteroidetes bacterium]|nr:hypothetical protein [Bacteroidota bacterium]
MIAIFRIDYEGLAARLHITADELRHSLTVDPEFLFEQLRKNKSYFTLERTDTSESLKEPEALSMFLRDMKADGDIRNLLWQRRMASIENKLDQILSAGGPPASLSASA